MKKPERLEILTISSPSVVNQAFEVDQGLITPDGPQTGDHKTVLAVERAELLSGQVNYEEINPPPPPRLPGTPAGTAGSAVLRSPPPHFSGHEHVINQILLSPDPIINNLDPVTPWMEAPNPAMSTHDGGEDAAILKLPEREREIWTQNFKKTT